MSGLGVKLTLRQNVADRFNSGAPRASMPASCGYSSKGTTMPVVTIHQANTNLVKRAKALPTRYGRARGRRND